MACLRQAAGSAAAALSAVRHPQCADRGERDRGGGRRRRLRVPAAARHGRGALRGVAGRGARRRLPGLCAGRQPPRSAGLSGAAAAGERRQFLVRGGRGRSERADRGDPEAAAGLHRRRRRTPAIRTFRCRAISTGRRGKIPRASSSATARRSTRCCAEVERGGTEGCTRRAADRWRRARRAHRGRCCRRSTWALWDRWSKAGAATARAAMAAAAAGFAGLERNAGRAPRRNRWSAPAELIEAARGRLIALLQAKAARRWTTPVRGARGGGLLPLLRRRGAARARPASRCRGRPASPTSCTTAAAACSSASAHGIFRWRSSSARSPRRWPPAMRWWQSPPSRRRWWRPRRCGCCIGPACRQARCNSCRATAQSARHWSPIRGWPASPSPARPRSGAPSTGRSPPRTGRSCR